MKAMKWFGAGLIIIGALTGLIASLGFQNLAFTIGGGVFFFIGWFIFLKA